MYEIPVNFEHFSDKDLYAYCKKAGFNALTWSRKFMAAIPEVAKRRLYKKYGYCSIHEFASKLAGVSHDNVDEVLRVSEKFKELPKMKELIGEVGLSKLRVVACVANKENEKDLSEKVKKMTKSSLEIYVREMFGKNGDQRKEIAGFTLPGEENGNRGSNEFPLTEKQISLFSDGAKVEPKVANPQNHDKRTFTIQIDEDTEFELRKFKQNLEKDRKEPVDWNFALKEMVKRASDEQKILPENAKKSSSASGPRTRPVSVSRYIPAKIRQDLQEKYHGHCAYKGCNKPAEQIHHKDGFAKKHTHENLVPLCKAHHDFIHQNFAEPQNIEVDKIFNFYKMKHCP